MVTQDFFGIASASFPPVSDGIALDSSSQSASDISFCCGHCNASLVVDRTASGLTLNCQHCGRPTRVPSPIGPPSSAETHSTHADLELRLKENAAQRTEVIGHINQVSIQLHRWQHRLKVLNERQAQLEVEIAAAVRDSS